MASVLLDHPVDVAMTGGRLRYEAAITNGLPLGRIATLEVRLARSAIEIEAAQRVRYRVFYEELGAKGAAALAVDRRDADRFDAICDHLLVLDTALPGSELDRIVGTYRLLRDTVARANGGFYSADEFDLDGLVARHPERRFMELGRSCVLPEYRSKRTIGVLWQGIWAYVNHHGVDVMAGCASFPGTAPAVHASALSFLVQNCRAVPEWDVRAVPERYNAMELLPREKVDARSALNALPPLVKGYLRLGARIGDGCVIDHDFSTIDVFVILPVDTISQRYIDHYGPEGERYAS
jgi:putative hemolysin